MARCTATVNDDRLLELPETARQQLYPGQKINIDVPEGSLHGPNFELLAMLKDLAEMKKDMPESDPTYTDAIIRWVRSGDMYGYKC
jgi:hypothetical protein